MQIILRGPAAGYALGRDVLSQAVREADGRSEGTEILNAVYSRLGVSDPGGIVSFVYGKDTDKAAIAAFSSIALTLSAQGNHRAVDILNRGAKKTAPGGLPHCPAGGTAQRR